MLYETINELNDELSNKWITLQNFLLGILIHNTESIPGDNSTGQLPVEKPSGR